VQQALARQNCFQSTRTIQAKLKQANATNIS